MKDQHLSNPTHYTTEKLTFAAYLVATGKADIVAARPQGKGKSVVFVLSNPPTSDDVTSFFNGSAPVSALRYAETINMLKSIAYEVLRCSGSAK